MLVAEAGSAHGLLQRMKLARLASLLDATKLYSSIPQLICSLVDNSMHKLLQKVDQASNTIASIGLRIL